MDEGPEGRLLVIDFEIDRYDNRREYIYYTYEKYDESKTLVSLDDDDVVVSEDDYATITVKWTDDSPWWHGDAIIYNPYDLKDVRFQFPKGLVYYPVTDGMPEMEKADMSKREALLVGKWICQEQVYTDPQDPKRDHRDIYMDDEYGMEFTPDYWYTLWAGDDELLEWGGHNDSWWIKDTLLCSNSLNDWGDDFSIVSLTEKEMVLRTWYADGDFVTAKFYKYNEEEGLLGDRLEYVDLGLSVKWATRNLGAEDKDAPIAGKYYAWGETQAKSEYTPENYKFYKKQGTQNWSWYKLTKYCSDPHGGYEGFVDNKMTLDTEDDAARAIRGKEWRMPTPEEMEELVSNCTWSWTRQEGVGGYKVTGKTGYYIFLPAARYTGNDNWRECGYYLTNSKMNDTEPGDYPMLKAFRFDSYSSPKVGKMYDIVFHHYGCSIRPVRP